MVLLTANPRGEGLRIGGAVGDRWPPWPLSYEILCGRGFHVCYPAIRSCLPEHPGRGSYPSARVDFFRIAGYIIPASSEAGIIFISRYRRVAKLRATFVPLSRKFATRAPGPPK